MLLYVTFLYPADRPNGKKNPKQQKTQHGLHHITFVSLRCGAEHGKAYTEEMYTLNI